MPVTLSYPGVYVEEINTLSLSITSAATAVPLFVFPAVAPLSLEVNDDLIEKVTATQLTTFTSADAQQKEIKKAFSDIKTAGTKSAYPILLAHFAKYGAKDPNKFVTAEDIASLSALSILNKPLDTNGLTVPLKVTNWMDYLTQIAPYLLPARLALSLSVSFEDDDFEFDTFNSNLLKVLAVLEGLGYEEMRQYFLNGGGPCHILLNFAKDETAAKAAALAAPGAEATKAIKAYLEHHADITLLCPMAGNKSFDEGVIALAASNAATKVFSLTAATYDVSDTNKSEADRLLVSKPAFPSQSAAYFPWLSTDSSVMDMMPSGTFRFIGTTKAASGVSNYDTGSGNAVTAKTDATKTKSTVVGFDELSPELKGKFQNAMAKKKEHHSKVTLSPVPAVAGAYCLTDNSRGVWKAPANVALTGVNTLCDQVGVPVFVTDALNETLMTKGVNAIRYFAGEGYRIWGARTQENPKSTDWRYIPVRRLFNSVESDILAAMQVAVFEPNTPATWEIVRAAIDNYLHSLWQKGALLGEKPEDAYFVRIGLNVTMSAAEIDAGQMKVKVGMAAVRPAEFIILEFSQSQQ